MSIPGHTVEFADARDWWKRHVSCLYRVQSEDMYNHKTHAWMCMASAIGHRCMIRKCPVLNATRRNHDPGPDHLHRNRGRPGEPVAAEVRAGVMTALAEWPDWLPGYTRRPDADHSAQAKPPEGIVVHSGESGPDLADAALQMSISYHFCWDVERGAPGRFVQLVSLQRRAYHAGKEGNDWIGIALSGPWDQNPRSEHERLEFIALRTALYDAFGGHLRYWCRHSDITPGKRDPGPGLEAATWMGGLTWRKGP